MSREMFRQGDVLVVREDQLPDNSEEVAWQDRVVLAYGELTGHAHAIDAVLAKMYSHGDTRFIVIGKDGADLKHEEHSPIHLKEGVYKIVHQREYAPDMDRIVKD